MMILEFSHVNNPLINQAYHQFSFNVIPKIGKVVANDEASYQYLVESIRKFPKQDELLNMMKKEGFSCCTYVNFTFGVVAVHTGFKL
jgi:ubiquinone/menaquinone biosynthesis C-methylase UbiE